MYIKTILTQNSIFTHDQVFIFTHYPKDVIDEMLKDPSEIFERAIAPQYLLLN